MNWEHADTREPLPGVVRTPEERFQQLPDFPFETHYVDMGHTYSDGPLRMHYLDEGPPDGQIVLALHDEASWSYLYRRMIPILVEYGIRVVAPDLIGFGRSDKPVERTAHSVAQHVTWLREFVRSLELNEITLMCQGWGGVVGLAVLSHEPDRFDRVVCGGTMLPTCDGEVRIETGYRSYPLNDREQAVTTAILEAMAWTQREPALNASSAMARTAATDLPSTVLAAYDAPFPDERFKAGLRQLPLLVPLTPDDPAAATNRATLRALSRFERPFLTLWGDADAAARGWQQVLQERVPGAAGQPHQTWQGTGCCWPEDNASRAARVIIDWLFEHVRAGQPGDSPPASDRGTTSGPDPRPMSGATADVSTARRRDAKLTWEAIRARDDIRLYAGNIPWYRVSNPGLGWLAEQYDRLIGLSIKRHDSHHVLHELSLPIPLPDASVSYFQSEEVFHYLPLDIVLGILNEIHRILRPGALLRMSFPDYGCDVLRDRSLYDVSGRIVFDTGTGGSPSSPTTQWFGRIDVVRDLIGASRFGSQGTVEYLHYYEMDGTPVMRPIDYTKGYVARTPDHDARVMEPYRPMSMVIDLTRR